MHGASVQLTEWWSSRVK